MILTIASNLSKSVKFLTNPKLAWRFVRFKMNRAETMAEAFDELFAKVIDYKAEFKKPQKRGFKLYGTEKINKISFLKDGFIIAREKDELMSTKYSIDVVKGSGEDEKAIVGLSKKVIHSNMSRGPSSTDYYKQVEGECHEVNIPQEIWEFAKQIELILKMKEAGKLE